MKLIVTLLIAAAASSPLCAETCPNPAANWTYDWEWAGIKRFYKLTDRDQDGRFEEVSIQLRNDSGKRMRIAFVWKARSLGDVYTPAKQVRLVLEKGAVSEPSQELTIAVPQTSMRASNTCFAGFYADSWKIEEAR